MKMLINTIKEDQLKARKEKNDNIKVTLLTTLIGEAERIGKDAGNREPTDEEVLGVVKKFLKGVNETLSALGYNEPKHYHEKYLLEMYLPKQMSKEEILTAIRSAPFEGKITKGLVMGYLKQNFPDQYDGKVAAQAVDEFLKVK